MKVPDPNDIKLNKGVMEVTDSPTGCMLIKREVIEKMIEKYPDKEIVQESFGIIENKYDDDEFEEDKKVELEKPKNIEKQKTKKINLFKLLLVFIISFVALILIVDTFIMQISKYIPFAEKYLDNLYQSIIDISLFFQNLIK